MYRQSTQLLMLRHAKVTIDELQHPRDWLLSEEGQEQAKALVHNPLFESVTAIYSSPEMKARQSVEPLSNYLGLPIIVIEDLREAHLDRYYGNRTEFMLMKESKFLDPSLDIGESHEDALNRFKSQIEGIKSYSSGSTSLIVSHGTIMTLYLGYLQRMSPVEMFNYWKRLPFCMVEEIS